MNYLDDIVNVNKKAFREAMGKIKKNPVSICLPMIFSILFFGVDKFKFIFYQLGFIGGFIMPLIYAMLMSVLYDLLSNLIYYDKLSFNNLQRSVKNYFGSIYSVYFILILVGYFLPAINNVTLQIIIWLIIYVVFNPMSETIYIKDQSYTSAYAYCVDFMKENFLQWIIPLIISFAGMYLFGGLQFIADNAVLNIPLGVEFAGFDSSYILKFIVFELIAGIYIIYRACLFKILSTSTMRKRLYMGGF